MNDLILMNLKDPTERTFMSVATPAPHGPFFVSYFFIFLSKY